MGANVTDKELEHTATLHTGMPVVHLSEDLVEEAQDETVKKGLIGISLESLDLDLQHSQSYGMKVPGGCISNPTGPGC